jgi:L-ascorbate metabolism protein UlaG (beta-lactamase superfamily)
MQKRRVRRPFWTQKLGQMGQLVWESHAEPIRGVARRPVAVAAGELGVMFLGHSSFLLQFGGSPTQAPANVLVDPVFATRLVVLRRMTRAGVRVEDLPAIDLVLLTHAHMDHLNRPTLRRVARATRRRTGSGPIAIVPRGVEDLVRGMGFREVRTLAWWESTEAAGLKITLTPAKHWGARLFTDVHRLFGGYVLEDASGHKLYHSGDTAYFEGFKEIGERLHPRVALLPIGAYFPDAYRAVHTSPEEALQGFVDVGAELMVPMHFGTFRLGREPVDEPVQRLLAEARKLGIESKVKVLGEGESLVLPPQS